MTDIAALDAKGKQTLLTLSIQGSGDRQLDRRDR